MERRWKVLAVTSVAVFMGFLDVTIVNVAFPDIERDFSEASRADLSWVLNAYNIVFAALLVPAGRLADLVGRRRMFLDRHRRLPRRLGAVRRRRLGRAARGRAHPAGGGGAVLVPTSLALLLPEFPARQRATAMAIWTATGAIAAALGPVARRLLVDAAGWRWVFFVNVPIGLLALIPARRLLRETRDPDAVPAGRARQRAAGRGRRRCSRSASSRAPTGAGTARACSARSAPAALLLPAVVLRSARHPAPVIELGPLPGALVRGRERRHVRLLGRLLRAAPRATSCS